ncbi:NUDIX hydrolase [Branchiibius cervicis]|uniref:NUDIX hydrolase n=1 Tax=Branchiibius cervicis TaxID=908252 RepID=A0ABW2ARM0_9MICO
MTADRAVRVGAYAVCVWDRKILLSHQISSGPARGQWTLPGGGVEFGEDPAAAAARECQEETGLTPTIGKPIGVHSAVATGPTTDLHGIRLLFEGRFKGDERPEPVSPDDEEIDAVGWFPCDALPEPVTAWAQQAAESFGAAAVHAVPFVLNGRTGVLEVDYAVNASLERSGFDMFDQAEFDPRLALAHPTFAARVASFDGQGYRTASAFIQWVDTERTVADRVDRERELDVPEVFRSAGVPFFASGYPAAMYDAPANNRNGADRLRWEATTWFVAAPARWTDGKVLPVLGFRWGYLDDGQRLALLPLQVLDADSWQQDRPWLSRAAPNFVFD